MLLNSTKFIDPIADCLDNLFSSTQFSGIFSILARLSLAVICGGIIGVERATKRHAAGFRTYILVCLGATIAMITNIYISETMGTGDSGRFGAQVISGIGFLGAGTILVTSRNQIKGLTTAAGLWASACMGLSIGAGFYSLAIIGCFIIVSSLMFLPYIENIFKRNSRSHDFHVELKDSNYLKPFISFIRSKNLSIKSLSRNNAYAGSSLSVYTLTISTDNNKEFHGKKYMNLIGLFNELDYVNFIEELY